MTDHYEPQGAAEHCRALCDKMEAIARVAKRDHPESRAHKIPFDADPTPEAEEMRARGWLVEPGDVPCDCEDCLKLPEPERVRTMYYLTLDLEVMP